MTIALDYSPNVAMALRLLIKYGGTVNEKSAASLVMIVAISSTFSLGKDTDS